MQIRDREKESLRWEILKATEEYLARGGRINKIEQAEVDLKTDYESFPIDAEDSDDSSDLANDDLMMRLKGTKWD